MGKYTEYIKVNLPNTQEESVSGNGEGCWFLVDQATKDVHDTDVEGGIYEGKLDNDSIYYPNLKAGEILQFEMRGKKRPVALYDHLQAFRPKGYNWRVDNPSILDNLMQR